MYHGVELCAESEEDPVSKQSKIGFLGTGKMGDILVRGLIASGIRSADQVTVFDVMPEYAARMSEELDVNAADTAKKLVAACDIIFLCVKPQQFSSAAADLRTSFKATKCAVTIMAGVTSETVREELGGKCSVVRVMPNTPCLVNQGAAAVAADTGAPQEVMDLVFELFASVGVAVWVNESQMNTVTALSGSGPAYVFMMMEAMTDAGVTSGLDRPTARKLAVQTVLGSATMAQQTDTPLSVLRAQVSSPGGTTVAATGELERRGFRAVIIDAITAARERGEELGK